MNNDYEKKNSFRMRQDSSHKERRDSSVEETGKTEAADGFRRTLAEKFLHTYITYHTYYRKLFPEEEGFTRAPMKMIGALWVQRKCSLKNYAPYYPSRIPTAALWSISW